MEYQDGDIVQTDQGVFKLSGGTWKPHKTSNQLLGATRSALEGMTLGFSDELGLWLAAAAAKATSDEPIKDIYRSMKDQYNQEQGQYQSEHPLQSFGATMGGGLLMGAGPVSGLMKSGFGVTHPLMTMSGIGAGTGALAGLGFAPTMGDVPKQAAIGATTGALIPPVVYGASKVLGSPLKAAGRAFINAFETPAERSNRMISEAFARDQIPISEIIQKAQELGPDGRLVDLGGPNVQQLGQTVSSYPGEAKKAAQFLTERVHGSTERLLKQVSNNSNGKTAYKALKESLLNKKAESAPFYQKAFNEDQNVPQDAIQGLLNNLDDSIYQYEGTSIGRVLNTVRRSLVNKTEDGEIPKTSILKLHAAKMDLDTKIGEAVRSTGKSPLVSQLMDVKKQLLEVLDTSANYKEGRRIFSTDSAYESAIDLGRKILSSDPEMMDDVLQGMSLAEKQGYSIGATQAITDKLKTAGVDKNAANKLNTTIVRERMANAFQDPEDYNKFIKQLESENIFAKTRDFVVGNSATQARLNAEKSLVNESTITTNPITAGLSIIRNWFKSQTQIPEPVRDEIGEKLFVSAVTGKELEKSVIRKMQRYDLTEKILKDVIARAKSGVAVTSGEVAQ